ncbi:hypothetical protein SmJEL517_g05840 [Synchytrium microbalum]|uniref:RanBP2-type domain-containing protein n=1 Tax=Synchytrium microbalum TaxID=1806994 RepID=A0A507BZD4_9FUNG|nr:uncharacterized protein SmJEL517_g05840 [Synchytrium microbalum]TPX30633.1 hypothetical protein SmJEL517_g05840 [Synchytrium microbalum]
MTNSSSDNPPFSSPTTPETHLIAVYFEREDSNSAGKNGDYVAMHVCVVGRDEVVEVVEQYSVLIRDVDSNGEHALDTLTSTLDALTFASHTFALVTHGEYDIRGKLIHDAAQQNIVLPPHYNIFYNLIDEVGIYCRASSRAVPADVGLDGLAKCIFGDSVDADAEVVRESPAVTMGRMIIEIFRWCSTYTGPDVPFTAPINVTSQLNDFLQTQSNIVKVVGLPMRIAYSFIDTWLSPQTIKPKQVLLSRHIDGSPNGTAYLVFGSHEDAKTALALDYSLLGDERVLVQPCVGSEVVDVRRDTVSTKESAKPGDWVCDGCQFYNFATRKTCFNCTIPAHPSVLTTPIELKPGDWICHCTTHNFASRHTCMKCTSPRPDTPHTPRKKTTWTCASCRAINNDGRRHCGACGAVNVKTRVPDRPGDWTCSNCKYYNYASRDKCHRCHTLKSLPLPPASLASSSDTLHRPQRTSSYGSGSEELTELDFQESRPHHHQQQYHIPQQQPHYQQQQYQYPMYGFTVYPNAPIVWAPQQAFYPFQQGQQQGQQFWGNDGSVLRPPLYDETQQHPQQ